MPAALSISWEGLCEGDGPQPQQGWGQGRDPGWKGTMLGYQGIMPGWHYMGRRCRQVRRGGVGRLARHGLPCLSLPSTTVLLPQGC